MRWFPLVYGPMLQVTSATKDHFQKNHNYLKPGAPSSPAMNKTVENDTMPSEWLRGCLRKADHLTNSSAGNDCRAIQKPTRWVSFDSLRAQCETVAFELLSVTFILL